MSMKRCTVLFAGCAVAMTSSAVSGQQLLPYFTSGGAYHVSAEGVVSAVADQNIRSNGSRRWAVAWRQGVGKG